MSYSRPAVRSTIGGMTQRRGQMHANSRPIRSRQTGSHPRLREVVARHLEAGYRRCPSESGRRAFADVADRLAADAFVLDAGCGTGSGTFVLARRHPRRLVLGVDKSAARLAIGQRDIDSGTAPGNAILLRCELVDFWQLAAAAGLRCERQYLLYPNPWPKPDQFMRRWHAHPVLPALLALGGSIELRTNWRVYAEEFAEALRLAGLDACLEKFVADDPLTPFERKYANSGHALWRCVAGAVAGTGIRTV
jgi:tRNA G46 methylase TrmB